jgi:hypothetical protein
MGAMRNAYKILVGKPEGKRSLERSGSSWEDNIRMDLRVSDGGWQFFSSPPRPDRFWGPPSLLSNNYRGRSPGVKQPGRESDHSPPSSAEVENAWSYTSTPPMRFHGVGLN